MAEQNRHESGRRIIAQGAVFLAWLSVAVFFGVKELRRKAELEQSLVSLSQAVRPDATLGELQALHAALDAAARPDWTILSLLALIISFRALFSIVGEARLTIWNARIKHLANKI